MTTRQEQLFFELYEALPRQGPGTAACTRRAFELCSGLPERPAIADLGCGVGRQTRDLAKLTDGSIVAIDAHGPLVERFREELPEAGQRASIEPRIGDMASLGPAGSFDLVWSEGALYFLGLEAAMELCERLLRADGYVAFTEAVWLRDDAPDDVRASFADYPTMGTIDDALALLARRGWRNVRHFVLPPEAWWDDFYGPMEAQLATMRRAYAGDPEALQILDELADEPAMYRRSGDTFGYAFFVARRPR